MPARKYRVSPTEDQREQLLNLARRGKSSARKVKRALILCKADEGRKDQEIAQALLVGASTVGRVRWRFVEEGLESALNQRPRPGQRRKLDGKQDAHLVAVARSQAPQGHTHWTLGLLANKVLELEYADCISPETVSQILKKTSSNRGIRRSGASQR